MLFFRGAIIPLAGDKIEKIYNTKADQSVCEITFLLSSAVCTLCSLGSKQRFTRHFSVS